MDEAHKVRLQAVTDKARLHDQTVQKMPLDEGEAKDYLIGWNKFKAELAILNEDAESSFTWVQDARIEVAEYDLDSQVTRYNTLATKIQLRKEQEAAAVLEALLKKKKAGEKLTLTEEEIVKAAEAAASHKDPIKLPSTPVTSTAPPRPPAKAGEGNPSTVPWGTIAVVGLVGAGILVVAMAASGAGRELGRQVGGSVRDRLRARRAPEDERTTWNEYFERGKR